MQAIPETIATGTARSSEPGRILDPIARVSEILFGLIMALTFTGALSAATAGREDVRELLIGMIGRARRIPPRISLHVPSRDSILIFSNVQLAIRTSNLIAILMLFCLGYWLGQHGGYRPWRIGSSVVALGVLLVAIAIALGG